MTSWQIGKETKETVRGIFFLGPKVTEDGDCSHEIKRCYEKPRQHIKKHRYYFANKTLSSQSYGFSSNYVWMWELDNKEK